jgi:putative transposase
MKRWSTEEKLLIISECENNGVSQTCRKYDLACSNYYNWKNKYDEEGIDGLEHNQIRKKENQELKSLKKENEKLKKLLAEKELVIEIKEELLKKTLQKKRQR